MGFLGVEPALLVVPDHAAGIMRVEAGDVVAPAIWLRRRANPPTAALGTSTQAATYVVLRMCRRGVSFTIEDRATRRHEERHMHRHKRREPLRLPRLERTTYRAEIAMLGRFAVTVDGAITPAHGWKRRTAASLVKVLALAPGHRLHREQVMDLLWRDEGPGNAAPKLHKAVPTSTPARRRSPPPCEPHRPPRRPRRGARVMKPEPRNG
jgi:hypothetical protein